MGVKKFILMALAAALVFGSGCAATSSMSFEKAPEGAVSSTGKPILGYAKVYNSGLFLFYYLPIWSGSISRPNQRKYDTFSHKIKEKYMDMMLKDLKARVNGSGVEDIDIRESAFGAFTLWIFWRRYISATAVIVE